MTPSREAVKALGTKRKKKIVAQFPACPWDHPSWEARKRFIENILIKDKTAVMEDECDKTGLKKFVITCKNCKERMGTVWAKNRKLDDWCSFRYEAWYNKKSWHGCRTPNISPVTGHLGIECVCGEDTRDFTVHPYLYHKEKQNKIGRAYGRSGSKYLVKEV